jgi:hypothetical protein
MHCVRGSSTHNSSSEIAAGRERTYRQEMAEAKQCFAITAKKEGGNRQSRPVASEKSEPSGSDGAASSGENGTNAYGRHDADHAGELYQEFRAAGFGVRSGHDANNLVGWIEPSRTEVSSSSRARITESALLPRCFGPLENSR